MTRHKTSTSPAIGIDLGTWKCCVGVVREGKVEIIENERGSKTTPSYVAFTEAERLVGEDAKDQVALNPTNTVFGIKRIIGRGFDDQSLRNDMKFWPFTVSPDKHERPRIPVRYRKEDKVLSPELVSAMMLEKMKLIAEFHLGCEVRDAVISVPAYFNNSQRQATKDAGVIAGLNVLGLINEPTAAVLAYRDNKARVEPHNVLIFDLGGGTFDAAVIRVDERSVEVKGVCGDAEFGGNEIDLLLMKRFEEEFVKKHGIPGLRDKKNLERLRTASEKAKKTLTLLPKANVQVDSLIEDIDFSPSIKRHDFEQLFHTDAKERIVSVLRNVLKQANIAHSAIDEVVLVGGTSRIPMIQTILKEFFCGKALNKTVNPDEAVAHGAALRAAHLAGDNEVEEVYVDDMFQVLLATEMKRMDGKFRNFRAIPKESFHILNCSTKDEVEECNEESDERFSHKEKVMKLYKLNSFGIFEIFPSGYENPKETRLPGRECLAESEITQLADQVVRFTQDDKELMESVAAVNDLQALCFQTKTLVTSIRFSQKLEPAIVKNIAGNCDEIIRWLDDNDSASKTEYQHKKRELLDRIQSFIKKSHVKVDDFHEVDKKWFRTISSVQSKQPSCIALKHTSEQELISSDPLSTQSAPQKQRQYSSAQSSPTIPKQGKSSLARPSTTPHQEGLLSYAQSSPTPPKRGHSSSDQPSQTPQKRKQSCSAQPTATPHEQGESSSVQPSPAPSEQGQSCLAQPKPTHLKQVQSGSAQSSPKPPAEQGQSSSSQLTPSEQGQLSTAQPASTSPEHGQSCSANPIPTSPEQGHSSSAQSTLTSLEQVQSSSAQPTPTFQEHGQSSSDQPTPTSPEQGQSSSAQLTPTSPEQGQSSTAQSTLTSLEQVQSSSAQPAPTFQEHGQSSLDQPTPTSPEHGQSSSVQSTPTSPKQGQSSTTQTKPTSAEQVQSSTAKPTPTFPEQVQSSSAQPTPTFLEQRQFSSARSTPTSPEQGQSSTAQPTAMSPEQVQSSSAQTTPSSPNTPRSYDHSPYKSVYNTYHSKSYCQYLCRSIRINPAVNPSNPEVNPSSPEANPSIPMTSQHNTQRTLTPIARCRQEEPRHK